MANWESARRPPRFRILRAARTGYDEHEAARVAKDRKISFFSKVIKIYNFLAVKKRKHFLGGSLSAVSKRNFASKYTFDNIFKIYKMCTLLHRSKLNILAKIGCNLFWKFNIFLQILQKI